VGWVSLVTDPIARPSSQLTAGGRSRRSGLQWFLLALFALMLVALAATGISLATQVREMDRDDADTHVRVEEFTDLGTDSTLLASELVGFAAGISSIDDLNHAHSAAQGRFDGVVDDLRRLNDATLDRLLIDMNTALGVALKAIAASEGPGPIDRQAFAHASDEIVDASHALIDQAREVTTGQDNRSHISIWFLLTIVAVPAGALAVLLALGGVINGDLRKQNEETKQDLEREDDRRHRAERLAIGQARSMELIATGASLDVIAAAVSDIVMTETDGMWTVGPDGLTATTPEAGHLSPDLASAAGRILDLASDRDQIMSDLVFEANHDSLTRLFNRSSVLRELGRSMRRTRDDMSVAVLYVDLDQFKTVNDTFGHTFGDEILRQVATRLESAAREEDMVGRIGGDEFTVILAPVTKGDALVVAHRIVNSVGRPYSVGGIDIRIRASVGGSFAGPDSSPDQVLREADNAMYRAKHAHQPVMFADDDSRQAYRRRSEIRTRIGESFHDGSLIVVYQPLVETSTGNLCGVEALARLRTEDGVLPPALFIEVAEDTGQIVQLDRRVIEIATHQVADWNREFGMEIELAVNLSGAHVRDGDAMVRTAAIAQKSPLSPRLLTMEITEAVFLEDAAVVADRIGAISESGIRFAIDDFGTGYSSLAYLQMLPVDILKIDRAFVDGLGRSERDDAIVRAILDLARALDLEVVAEGVETPEQLDTLRELGCPMSQGYLFAKPLDPSEFEARWLADPVTCH